MLLRFILNPYWWIPLFTNSTITVNDHDLSIYAYLKGRKREGKKGEPGIDRSICVHRLTFQIRCQSGMGEGAARSQKLNLILPRVWQELTDFQLYVLFARVCITRKVEARAKVRLSPCTPIRNAGIPSIVLSLHRMPVPSSCLMNMIHLSGHSSSLTIS